jgi:hypothetical protein
MTQLEIATKVMWFGTMAYFPIVIVIVALALLKPFMERRFDVKIEYLNAFWVVRGGTRKQRFRIQLIPIAFMVVGLGLLSIGVLLLLKSPTPSS